MNYLLEKDELNHLVLFNGLIGLSLRNKPEEEQYKVWEKVIFNELLTKQPELKNECTHFKEQFKDAQFKNFLFKDLFEKKIELKNTSHFIFKKDLEYYGELENRYKLFINLADKDPDFYNMIHQAVQKNHGSDYYLFEAYFKIIKTVTLPQNEVLENIKKFQTNSELKNEKKKLLAYLNFNKDKKLYDFIIDDMNPAFTKSPLLTDYWENKLKLFPWPVRQEFIRQKIDANPFSDEEQIGYKFTLDKEWIISKFKLVPSIAGEFRGIFYTGL
jgi:hypothetical protein